MKELKILFYPNEHKKSSKNNKIPLYARISKGRAKTEVKLNAYIAESELHAWNPFTQRLDIPYNPVNKLLEDLIYDFNGLQYIYKNDFKTLLPIEVKEKLFRKEGEDYLDSVSLIKYCENYYTNNVIPNSNISQGTKKNYRKAINHLTNFLSYYNKGSVTIKDFTPELAFAFNDYLQKDIPEIKKIGIKDYSAASVITKIKAIFQRAYDTDIITKRPFKAVKLQRFYPKKDELKISEINGIIKLNLEENCKYTEYIDIFLFQVFTGLSYSDVFTLTWSDIYIENGEYILNKKREKTSEPILQILVSQALAIVLKYKEYSYPGNKVLPVRCLNDMNEKLKIIQAYAGITKKVTTHLARHTCNQFLNDLGCINANVINTMLGWSNCKQGMRMNYLRISFEQLKYAKDLYQLYLDKNIEN